MRQTYLLFGLLILVNHSIDLHNAIPSESAALRIDVQEDLYSVTVPGSELVLLIPKDGLMKNTNDEHSSDNGRYFQFESKLLPMVVSGWFEPEARFRGLEQFWKAEVSAWKRKGLPDPQDVEFLKLGNWNSIAYDMPFPKGTNSHLRAHWVQAGTWIDFHLSITSELSSSSSREKLKEFLNSIQVTSKN